MTRTLSGNLVLVFLLSDSFNVTLDWRIREDMSRFVNPIGAAAAAMRKPINRKVVQKLLERSSERPCEREFMRLVTLLPRSPEEEQDPNKSNRLLTAHKDLDECMRKAANHNNQDYVSFRLKQLSEIAATKKRRRRTETGKGRWNPSRVY